MVVKFELNNEWYKLYINYGMRKIAFFLIVNWLISNQGSDLKFVIKNI